MGKVDKMLSKILLFSFLLFIFLFFSSNVVDALSNGVTLYSGRPVKYVFWFIGDGMGMNHVYATEMFLARESKEPSIKNLDFTMFPNVGWMTTYAADSYITDSASAITAMATGKKTNDGVLNMDPSLKTKYKSIAEMARDMGYKVGVLTSVSIDHATPAGMYAHQPSRNNYYDIALELLNSNFNYFGGGGFLQPKGKDGKQKDIYDLAKEKGYKIVDSVESIKRIGKGDDKVIAINPILDNSKALPFAINRLRGMDIGLSLADFTRKAIEVLDNPKGFFMMVEGGKIDWAAHANDAVSVIYDVLDFNEAIKVALEFYKKHPYETIIIVTADHETGGLSIGYAGTKYEVYPELLSYQKISYDEFSKMVQEYREKAGEKAKLEDLLPLIEKYYGLSILDETTKKNLEEKAKLGNKEAKIKLQLSLNSYEVEEIEKAFSISMMDPQKRPKDYKSYLMYGGYDPLTVVIIRILNQKAGIGFTSYSHTGTPVPVYAIGAGSHIFRGYYDNTDLYKKLCSLIGIDPFKEYILSSESKEISVSISR
uniref:Alkaline phosphatase n=1 Tax=Dictyoglomus turgidum TaxID=513050 RepID=A0A7C3WYD0_9BACT